MENFYLDSIELLNYRKFENTAFKLNPRMNVLIGKNASGKTTVLEAVTVILGAYLAAYKEYVPSRFVHNISDNDVMRKSLRPIRSIAMTARSTGFFSTWMHVFSDDVEVKDMLISTFKGTKVEYCKDW